jgi:SPP1 gp7 family putative phage head morphogenesis protein
VSADVDLLFALQLPPEKAIAYFRAKGYAIGWRWQDVWQEAQAKAFTVAGVMKVEILQDIRQQVDKALASGQTYSQFADNLIPVLQQRGWWGRAAQTDKETGEVSGKGLTPWRLKTIYQTNLQTAYSAGRYKAFADNVEARPYWQYTAVMDRRTRPTHAAMNGLVFAADDPFWDSFYPPNGFNCRCRVRALDSGNLSERGLALSSSAGRLSTVEVLVSRKPDAPTAPVARFEISPRRAVTTDVGWSYNPGKAAWQPDLGKYDADLVAQYRDRTPRQ